MGTEKEEDTIFKVMDIRTNPAELLVLMGLGIYTWTKVYGVYSIYLGGTAETFLSLAMLGAVWGAAFCIALTGAKIILYFLAVGIKHIFRKRK